MKVYKKGEDVLAEKQAQLPATPPRGGSLAGVHYAESYRACQRKFHLRYNMGIDERYHDKALIFGSAIHEAKAAYYLAWDLDAGIERGHKELRDRRDEFASPDDYDFSLSRLKPLMVNWWSTYGKEDKAKYNVLAVEEEIRLPIPFTPGFVHTQRHDAILEAKSTGDVYTFDTKTASSSLDFTLNSVRLSDQVTAYCWGGMEVFGKRYKGFIIDVMYWSTRSMNPGTIKCQRSDAITKTDFELRMFQAGMGSLFNEVQAKERALVIGTPSPFLYARNSYYCHAFFRRCAYADICGINDSEIVKRLPDNLIKLDDAKRIDGLTYENIFQGEGPY